MNDVNNIVQKYSRTQIYGVTVIMFGHETVMLKIVCKLFKDMCKCTVLRYSRKSCDSIWAKRFNLGVSDLFLQNLTTWCQAIRDFFAQTVCMLTGKLTGKVTGSPLSLSLPRLTSRRRILRGNRLDGYV